MTLADAPARVSRALPRLGRCAAADPGLFARALGWRLALPVLKVAIPVKVLARWMDRSHKARPSAAAARVAAIERLIGEGGRMIISPNCLERSLLLYRFLSEAGADVSLVMGMRRDDAGVAGHAWIEVNGRPFADATAATYNPVVRFEPQTTRPVPNGPGSRVPGPGSRVPGPQSQSLESSVRVLGPQTQVLRPPVLESGRLTLDSGSEDLV